ncbi:hypothetical protein SAMN04488490_2825 [Marinobacter sp. LV10R510-11A]|nr:hypothetical protein SAMN04488490_2825 [Marinobacter sp. LV10R510-11A]
MVLIEAGQTETITTKGQGRGKTQDLTPAHSLPLIRQRA